MPELPRVLLGSLLVLGCSAPAFAQRPSSWSALQLGSPVQTANIRQLGKTCSYQEGLSFHAFSAFTRSWSTFPLHSASPQMAVMNDIAYAWEPLRFIAFSAYRGAFRAITVSAGAQLLNPSTQANDSIVVVKDGATLWAFSAFTGEWVSRPLASPAALVAVQRHALVVADGGTFSGLSAFRGRWVDLVPNDVGNAAQANGSWGVIEGANAIYGFSAQHEAWTSTSWPSGGVQSFNREDLILYASATQAVAYSGLTGRFSATPLPPAATLQSNALVAAAQSGTDLYLYSAVLGTWTHERVNAAAVLQVMPQVAMWTDTATGSVSAYSPFTASARTAPIHATSFQANQACATAIEDPNGKPFLYSALTGEWVPAPSDAKPLRPSLTWCGALLETQRGYAAFSGRTGRFVQIDVAPDALPWYDVNSSILAVEERLALHAFDARFDRWVTQAKQNPSPLAVSIWRTSLLAIDGQLAYGFGSQSGEIESFALPAPPTVVGANSESLRVGVGSLLAAFGSTPDLVTLYQFPEFRRVFPIGSTLELELNAEPNSLALLALGRAASTPANLFGLGLWWVDLATAQFLSLVVPAGEQRAIVRIDVPADPALRGFEPAFQAWVQTTSQNLYATRPTTVGLR